MRFALITALGSIVTSLNPSSSSPFNSLGECNAWLVVLSVPRMIGSCSWATAESGGASMLSGVEWDVWSRGIESDSGCTSCVQLQSAPSRMRSRQTSTYRWRVSQAACKTLVFKFTLRQGQSARLLGLSGSFVLCDIASRQKDPGFPAHVQAPAAVAMPARASLLAAPRVSMRHFVSCL